MCKSTAESRYEGAQHRNLGEGTLGKSKEKNMEEHDEAVVIRA